MIKNSSITYSIELGVTIGASGFLGILLTPYYGVKFYYVDLATIKWNGELIL